MAKSSGAPRQHGVTLKKHFGQYFLRDTRPIGTMFRHASLDETSSVLEIGGGSGVLTKAILGKHIARLWVFEIDPEWAQHLRTINDQKLTVYEQDFLQADLTQLLAPHAPWIVLANLPYHITFPILQRIQEHRELFAHGTVMVQEEVAQKIVATHGRACGALSHYFQWYFEWQLLEKIPPEAFYPQPKVFSRLLYFKPKKVDPPTHKKDEAEFWQFVRSCFKQPRRTLRNNLQQTHISLEHVPEELLKQRAQQLSTQQFIELWHLVHKN